MKTHHNERRLAAGFWPDKPGLAVSTLVFFLIPLVGSVGLQAFSGEWICINIPIHSLAEGLGAFVALMLVVLLSSQLRAKELPISYQWIMYGLIALAVLDAFHSAVEPGESFVWLHSTPVLIAGTFFAGVWLPRSATQEVPVLRRLFAVTSIVLLFAVLSVVFPDLRPSMLDNGELTPTAKAINGLGAILFLAVAVFFVMQFRTTRRFVDLLFAGFCLLNTWAGVIFPFSQVWTADWWYWHLESPRVSRRLSCLSQAASADGC